MFFVINFRIFECRTVKMAIVNQYGQKWNQFSQNFRSILNHLLRFVIASLIFTLKHRETTLILTVFYSRLKIEP